MSRQIRRIVSGAARFAVSPDVRVVWFEDEAVVFCPFSWETHLLNATAAAVLEFGSDTPFSEEEMGNALAEGLADAERGNALAFARAAIRELLELRLLTPAHLRVSDANR